MNDKTFYYDEMETPLGPLLIIMDNEKAVRIDFGNMADLDEKVNKWARKHFNNPVFIPDLNKAEEVKKELGEYFAGGRHHFSFGYSLYGTTFQKKVWKFLTKIIPYGETKTYREIAETVGNPKAARAVGGAVNKNPVSIVVPCHRVIGSNGKLVGYGGGLEKKEYLLRYENNRSLSTT